MKSVLTLRTASMAAIAIATLGQTAAANAAILIAADSVTVMGPGDSGSAAPLAAEDQQQETNGGGLTEIIVTATKRETNLQKTPISISVMGAETIRERKVQSLMDLADGGVPSLRVAPFESRQSALTVGIRGIVPLDANQPAREQGVGIYIDGV